MIPVAVAQCLLGWELPDQKYQHEVIATIRASYETGPKSLDLYAWCVYETHKANHGNVRKVSWYHLHSQLGASYKRVRRFSEHARAALKEKILAVYPDLCYEESPEGIMILPSKTAIPKQLR